MKRFLPLSLCIVLVALSSFVNAQLTTSISGTVKANDKALATASLMLYKATDSSLIKTAISDDKGTYQFNSIAYGNYYVIAEAVGFEKFKTTIFTLDDAHTSITVESIALKTTDKNLSTVSVTSTRPLIENKIDRTVVNVDASTTNTGLSALEVLEKSPGVVVDNDGNITLKGKQGVVVMIDGKPAYLSGQDLTNYLKNLPSSQLDQIEIMTQPPAKYDAAGNSGIINFKTKKSKVNGFNGNISTSVIFAKYFKNTNSINLNWRKGKVNMFGNYSYSHWEGFNDINIDRSFRNKRDDAFNRYTMQNTYGRFTGQPHTFKLGADFFASEKTTISLTYNGTIEDNRFTSNSISNIYDSLKNFVQYNKALSQNSDNWKSNGFNLDLQQKLKAGAELSADADYIVYDNNSNQFSNNYLYNADGTLAVTTEPNPYLLNGNLPSTINIYSFKSDFSKPLKKNASIEAGVKFSYVTTDNNAQYTLYDTALAKWNVDNGRSNHFIYKENINAGYINFKKEIKKFSMQLGLRAEQTIAKGNQVTKGIKFDRNYTKLFPTAYFSYKLNDSNTFVLSYGRRIERPDYSDLNPFQFQLDRYTYQQGNPNLQPQFSHNIELSYNYKGALNISANYTIISDIINDVLITEKVQETDSNYVTYQIKQNIASSRNIGLSVNYGKQVNKWWNINVFANVFNNNYKGNISGEDIDASITAFTGNLSSQFNLGKGWKSEINGFYNSKNLVSSVIIARPMGVFSVGASKSFLKDKASVRVNIRDPFYVMRFRGYTELNTFRADINSRWDNRRGIVTFTYRFGKTTAQTQRQRKNSGADDEQNRVKSGGGE